MRRFIIEQLRLGTSPQDLCDIMRGLIDELDNAKQYIQAINESSFRP